MLYLIYGQRRLPTGPYQYIKVYAVVQCISDVTGPSPVVLACSTVVQILQYDRLKRSSVMGGMNYHIEFQFEDGVTWLARIRRSNATSPPPDPQGYIMCSEVATLQFLEKTRVPTPRVLDYNFDERSPIGVR